MIARKPYEELKLRFRPIAPQDYEAVREFLSEAGWQNRVADPDRFKRMIENTSRTVVATDGSCVVGFARALCDEVSHGYISTADRRRRMSGPSGGQ